MKTKLIKLIGNKLDHLNIIIDDVYEETEDNQLYIRIVLDREEIMNVEDVYNAAEIISPIVDDADLYEGEYILDIYAKSKGDINGH